MSADHVSNARSRLQRLKHLLGLDKAIAFTLLSRMWSSVSGLVILKLIATHLSVDEQGYYYTFGSLVALQIVFELGFSSVIVQLASHEAAHLTISPDGWVTGNLVAHQRLASILQRSVRWYLAASALMVSTVMLLGIHFFSRNQQASHTVAWLFPWCAVVFAATLTFQIDPVFSFLEGCGYVSEIAHTRFWQALTGSSLAWIALLLNHGLFAPALLILGQAIGGSIWLRTKRRLLHGLYSLNTGTNRITWSEVWPFQWRIAVSWLSGYFISQLFNPMLFVFRGPAEAGRMGMSLTLMNAISSVALSWVYTKAAPFGQMIARQQYTLLDNIFFRALRQSITLCCLGCLCLWCGDIYLYRKHSLYAARLLPPLPFGMLMCIPVLVQIVSSFALYLRAHKQEKFLIPSVTGAVSITLSTYLLGRYYGALGMVSGYLAISVFIGAGSAVYIFEKYRRLWHGL